MIVDKIGRITVSVVKASAGRLGNPPYSIPSAPEVMPGKPGSGVQLNNDLPPVQTTDDVSIEAPALLNETATPDEFLAGIDEDGLLNALSEAIAPDDLTQLAGVGVGTAAKLADAGVTTFAALAELTVDDLVGAGIRKATAEKALSSAKEMVG